MRGRSAAALLVVVVLTAGCMGVILGEDDLEFESGETVIENETVASSGYELQHEETQTLNETVSVAEGNETRIIVRNHMARYGPESDLPSGIGPIQVGLITTPDASVAGQSVNPLLRMDSYERAFRFLPETDESGFERYGNYTVEPFDGPATVTVFATESEADEDPEAFVHVMQVPRENGDAVLAYAMHPAGEAEAEAIPGLFSALEYTPPEDIDREHNGTDNDS